MGTIIRTIDAAGLTQIVLTNNSVEAYNPKVIRATMGAIFRVNVIVEEDLRKLQEAGFKLVVTSIKTEKSIYKLQYKKCAIVIGNEANGVSKKVMNMADEKVKIPMKGKAESLNAAVAASIVVYEFVRQTL